MNSSTSLAAGAVFGSFTVLSVLGGPLTGWLRPDLAMRWGAVAYALCVVGVIVTLRHGAISTFLAASLLAGVAQGVALSGGMRALLTATLPADRAGRLATVFLLNYSSAAVPNLIAGRFSHILNMLQIAYCYGGLVALGVAVVLLAARAERARPDSDRDHPHRPPPALHRHLEP